MKKFLFIFFSSITFYSQAGNDNYHIGGRSVGMGNASVCLSDYWSIHHNQGGLANVDKIGFGVSYESRFLTKNLALSSVGFVYPTKKSGTFGIVYKGFGGKLYRESKVGLAYGMKLAQNLSAGISINYHHLRIANDYGQKGGLTFEAGFIANIYKELSVGLHIFNPSQSKLNNYNREKIPTVFRLGLSNKFSDKVIANIEIEKDIDHKPVFKAGFEYQPIDILYIRAGIASNPSLPAIGIGVNIKEFRFDFGTTFHGTLGASPAFSLNYNF